MIECATIFSRSVRHANCKTAKLLIALQSCAAVVSFCVQVAAAFSVRANSLQIGKTSAVESQRGYAVSRSLVCECAENLLSPLNVWQDESYRPGVKIASRKSRGAHELVTISRRINSTLSGHGSDQISVPKPHDREADRRATSRDLSRFTGRAKFCAGQVLRTSPEEDRIHSDITQRLTSKRVYRSRLNLRRGNTSL